MKKISSDLNKQLIVGISAIVLISTLFIALFFLSQYRRVTLQKAEESLVSRAYEFTEIGRMIMSPTHQRPRDAYFDIMRNMMGNELMITSSTSQVLVASNGVNKNSINDYNTKYSDIKETEVTYSYSDYFNKKTLSVISPIIENGNVVGMVFLHQNVDLIYSSYISLIYLIIFSLIFSLVLSIILAIFYAKKFVLPIEKITNVARLIKEGDYSARVEIKRPDQLGELSSTIDQMSSCISTNIDEIKELEHRAKELVANVSHEFKTPLTVIRGYAYSMKDKTIKPSNDIYDKIIKNTVELEHLVNDLLDLNNYQIGNVILKKEDINLSELISSVSDEISLIAKDKNVAINTEINFDVFINADYSKIRQLLIILVDNALKYSNNDSKIIVKVLEGEIQIIDFGVGIDSKELDKIFNRYYKVSNDNNGYGIGLYIAKLIADSHGFKLDINSKKNKGTTVYLRFGA